MAVIPNTCKFHVVSSSVDTEERGSAEFQSQRKVYSMADIIETAGSSPYKLEGGARSVVTSAASSSNTIDAASTDSLVLGGQCNSVISPSSVILSGNDVDVPAGADGFFVGVATGTTAITRSGFSIGSNFMGATKNATFASTNGFIGAGSDNVLTAVQSFIGAGTNHTMPVGQPGNSAIISGFQHTNCGAYSFIGTGLSHSISGGTSNAIVAGNGNTMPGACVDRFIGAGSSNVNCANLSGILAGNNNSIGNNATGGFIAAGANNVIPDGLPYVHILGNGITADRSQTTFVSSLSIKAIPTASAGLPSGAVWSNSGVLNIIP